MDASGLIGMPVIPDARAEMDLEFWTIATVWKAEGLDAGQEVDQIRLVLVQSHGPTEGALYITGLGDVKIDVRRAPASPLYRTLHDVRQSIDDVATQGERIADRLRDLDESLGGLAELLMAALGDG